MVLNAPVFKQLSSLLWQDAMVDGSMGPPPGRMQKSMACEHEVGLLEALVAAFDLLPVFAIAGDEITATASKAMAIFMDDPRMPPQGVQP